MDHTKFSINSRRLLSTGLQKQPKTRLNLNYLAQLREQEMLLNLFSPKKDYTIIYIVLIVGFCFLAAYISHEVIQVTKSAVATPYNTVVDGVSTVYKDGRDFFGELLGLKQKYDNTLASDLPGKIKLQAQAHEVLLQYVKNQEDFNNTVKTTVSLRQDSLEIEQRSIIGQLMGVKSEIEQLKDLTLNKYEKYFYENSPTYRFIYMGTTWGFKTFYVGTGIGATGTMLLGAYKLYNSETFSKGMADM